MKNKKELGQHWLKNRAILEEIAELAAEGGARTIAGGDGKSAYGIAGETGVDGEKLGTCLEIGPGLGTLTSSLLRRFEKVVAVEYDAELARKLPGQFPRKNLEVINENILDYDFSQMTEGYTVAGNIPYYITSPIIEKLLTAGNLPRRIALLVQKEVAERVAKEGSSVFSLFVANRARAELGPVVKAEEFTPPPKVDSQVIVLTPRERVQYSEEIFKLIRLGFVAPRKKLIKNLEPLRARDDLKDIFLRLKLNVDARPSDLTLADWNNLYQKINE